MATEEIESEGTQRSPSHSNHYIIDFFKLLPQWLTVSVVVFVLAYVVALTLVAVITGRDVAFIPPKIGPSHRFQLITEVQELRKSIDEMSTKHYQQVQFLRTQLAINREKAAATADNFNENWEYKVNIGRYEREIEKLDTEFGEKLANLQKEMAKLEQRL
jgi:hypothetical protein